MASTKLVDYTDLFALNKSLDWLGAFLHGPMKQVRPQFGAYMKYSRYLEEGTHNKDGSWKMMPRPHIEVAVKKEASAIVKELKRYSDQLAQDVIHKGAGLNSAQLKKDYANTWIRALNDKPAQTARVFARSLKIFKKGFHIRSIHGYAYDRNDSEIRAEQAAAAKEAAGM